MIELDNRFLYIINKRRELEKENHYPIVFQNLSTYVLNSLNIQNDKNIYNNKIDIIWKNSNINKNDLYFINNFSEDSKNIILNYYKIIIKRKLPKNADEYMLKILIGILLTDIFPKWNKDENKYSDDIKKMDELTENFSLSKDFSEYYIKFSNLDREKLYKIVKFLEKVNKENKENEECQKMVKKKSKQDSKFTNC